MKIEPSLRERLVSSVNRQRLIDTAVRLIDVPSRTGEAGAAADRLAEILEADGFAVERPDGGFPEAPAVVVRFSSGHPGRTLQFDGHLDTVHLPFIPPTVDGEYIRGSGAADMKAGVAAAVEALRALRDAEAFSGGSILLTAHDLHEAPWGDGRQLDRMIREGCAGDAVLIPEPSHKTLAVRGRGAATWKLTIRRDGPPVHEVMRPREEPSVIAAGAELVRAFGQLDQRLSADPDSICGPASVFIGQIHSGEIYNQYPQECWLQGTRRWLPGTSHLDVEREFRAILDDVATSTRTHIDCEWIVIRDAFHLNQEDPIVRDFQDAYSSVSGQTLPIGPKPFVDDGNSFWANAGVAAITHGPRAGGQHTIDEWVSIDDLIRVAQVYALTAVSYCPRENA